MGAFFPPTPSARTNPEIDRGSRKRQGLDMTQIADQRQIPWGWGEEGGGTRVSPHSFLCGVSSMAGMSSSIRICSPRKPTDGRKPPPNDPEQRLNRRERKGRKPRAKVYDGWLEVHRKGNIKNDGGPKLIATPSGRSQARHIARATIPSHRRWVARKDPRAQVMAGEWDIPTR